MKKCYLFLFMFLGLPPCVHSQDSLHQNTIEIPEGITADGIPPIPYYLKETSKPYSFSRAAYLQDWHPLKTEMLVTTQLGATMQAYTVNKSGGMRKQITFFEEPVNQCLFDPRHGDFLIVQKDKDGDEFYQVYRLDLISGKTTLLSDGGKTYNYSLRWNKKGDKLFYLSMRSQQPYSEVYALDPKHPASRELMLRFEEPNCNLQDIAEDENTLLVTFPYQGSNQLNSLWLYHVKTKLKTLLLPAQGKTGSYYSAKFSRNGRGIYLLAPDDSGHSQLAYYHLQQRRLELLTHFKWDVRTASLSPDGRLLAFTVSEAGNARAYIYTTATKTYEPVEGISAGFIAGLTWAKDSRFLGFQFSSANANSDVYVWDSRSGKVVPWVQNELGGIDASLIPAPQPIGWKSFDGMEISGFLHPPGKKFTGRRPVIIDIHGGPVMQALPLYNPVTNYYTNALGIAVIYPNIRGSAGFGKNFAELDNGLKKEDALKDIGALLNWIAGRSDLDATRIMVTGGSYGGYMTYRSAVSYGDKIRCAAAAFCSPNLLDETGIDPAYLAFFSAEYGDINDPEMRNYLKEVSPLNNAARIKIPLLIVQGKNDPRVPLDGTQQMVKQVRAKGGTVWYMLAEDEGHGFMKPENEEYLFYATAWFIEKYLLN